MRVLPSRSRSRGRSHTPTAIELAVAFALVGSVLAVAVPTFVRELHASRLAEPVDGLKEIGAAAIAYAHEHPLPATPQGGQGFPPSAPMTPAVPPRGQCQPDPPGAWEDPGWRALDFRPVAPGAPHCFSFAFDSSVATTRASFQAHAHGDLDGDGITSTFQITGQYVEGDPRGPVIDPGMLVDSEVE
jgi:type II secretory pathway pseudopilin PulG